MDTIKEIEKTRQMLIDKINTEMDLLIKKIKDQSENNTNKPNLEELYPFTLNPSVFKGLKPIGVIFKDGENEQRKETVTWKKVAQIILQDCIKDSANKEAVIKLCGNLFGNTRIILSKNKKGMISPIEIDKRLYFETHYDTESLLRILRTKILDQVNYDYNQINIVIRNI